MNYSDKLDALSRDPLVARMGTYRHHLVYSTLEHSRRVARMSHTLSAALRLPVDEDAMLLGAMLHDCYLYERREEGMGGLPHYRLHPAVALAQASREFDLSEREKNIILSHMWPINIRELPRSREAWLVTVSDKLATVYESTVGLGWRALTGRKFRPAGE